MITNIISVQDINRSELREMSNRNMRELFRGSSHLLYILAFTTMKDFHYNDPARSLGVATPTMSSLKNSTDPKVSHLFP